MRTISCCILALAILFTAVASANPNGDMKSSPLFKASLGNSIARLEGKATPARTSNGGIETEKPGCIRPDVPETQGGTETCLPFCEETTAPQATCSASCFGTCEQQSTCSSTCYSTCASTCANTCLGGACYNFYGTIVWYNNSGGGTGSDWKWDLPNYLLDVYYWCVTASDGGVVYVKFGSGSFITLGAFNVNNGTYNYTVPGPSGQSSFTIRGSTLVGYSPYNDCWMDPYEYPDWPISADNTVGHGPYATNQVNVTVPLYQ